MIKSRKRLSRDFLSLILCALMALALIPLSIFAPGTGQGQAFAVTSAEKQAEADEMMAKLDALQTELNKVSDQYYAAIDAHNLALARMYEAQERVTAAETRIAELQERLGNRAVRLYRGGQSSFLDVIFGAQSFSEFINAMDMVNRVNEQDALMVAETKTLRNEAEAARLEYTAQETIAAEQERAVFQLKVDMEGAAASMQEQVAQLTAEAAELLAAEEAAAEAARLKAEEDARRAAQSGNGGNPVTPDQVGRVPLLTHPCPGYPISSGYGYRTFDDSFHMGTDFAAPTGTPVYAAASGTVIIANYSSSAGNWVVISHGNGVVTKYMHASQLLTSA
ncbi:MAG: peptidoglycan DD-metalloendopeptidase family protein, partial [Coriobacteriales bacterium]|nr:peptidoglycan DD-metalloendopeptidase family protein [Coriobacteriales bacterium]